MNTLKIALGHVFNAATGTDQGHGQGSRVTANNIPLPPADSSVVSLPNAEEMAKRAPLELAKAEGEKLGAAILGAEQGVTVAQESLSNTKLGGLKALAELGDESQRSLFIKAVGDCFAVSDGDKIRKAHQNYLAELRRVSIGIKNGWGSEVKKALMAEKGTYAQRVEALPKTGDTRGGRTQAVTQGDVLKQAQELVAQHGAEKAAEMLSKAPVTEKPEPEEKKEPSTMTEISEGIAQAAKPEVQPPQRHSQQPEVTLDQGMQIILHCHENQIEGYMMALAKRMSLSNVQRYKDVAELLTKRLDSWASDDAKEQAASEVPAQAAVNG